MQATATCELPEAFDGIEFRAIRRQEIQCESIGMLFSPLLMEFGMVIPGVVCDDYNTPAASGADPAQAPQEPMECQGIESAYLPLGHKLAVPQAYSPKVANAATSGMMEQNRISLLRWHPHPAARSVLLEMHLVERPQVNVGISHEPSEFF